MWLNIDQLFPVVITMTDVHVCGLATEGTKCILIQGKMGRRHYIQNIKLISMI